MRRNIRQLASKVDKDIKHAEKRKEEALKQKQIIDSRKEGVEHVGRV